jgi:hypothetical protein
MLKFVIVGTVMAVASAMNHPITQDIISEIKAKASTWAPMEINENPLAGYTSKHLYSLLSAKNDTDNDWSDFATVAAVGAYPDNFNAATQWPNYVTPIRDQ